MVVSDDNITQGLKEQIIKQVEFYFSDSNLPRDGFMQNEIKKNSEGYVDLSILCTFSRMKKHLQLESFVKAEAVQNNTVQLVASILRSSELLQVNESGYQVKRSIALNKDLNEVKQEVDQRSVYVVPFPYNVTLDELSNYFEQQVKIKAIMMRKHPNGPFRGSIFVECENEQEQNKLLSLNLMLHGAPLRMEKKLNFINRKVEERHQKPGSPYNQDNQQTNQATKQVIEVDDGTQEDTACLEIGANSAKQVLIQADTQEIPQQQQKEIKQEQKEQINTQQQQKQNLQDGQKRGQKKSWEEIQIDEDYTPGLVIRFEFKDAPPSDLTFGIIKNAFGDSEGGVAFVNYERGWKDGYVQFQSPDKLQIFLAQQEDPLKLSIQDKQVGIQNLKGDDDLKYFKETIERKKKAIWQKIEKQQNQNKGGFKRKNWGNNNNKGGRGNKRFKR